MDIGDLLAPKGVVLRGGASSKRQALHALSSLSLSTTHQCVSWDFINI